MGTAIEPHQLGGTSISVSYIHTPLATSPSSRSRRPSVQGDPLSPSRGSLDGQTIVLLRSVRASLASSSGGPSADQQPQPEEISPATPAEEDEDCTFQMDGN